MVTRSNTARRADLEKAVRGSFARYIARNPRSREEDLKAADHMPGGNTRSSIFHPPFPLTIAMGEGQYVEDIDHNRYTNFVGEFGAGLFGHSNGVIAVAIQRAISDGWVLGGPNRHERILAAELVKRFASIERIRFTNSGTEANMMAISISRVVSGRSKVMVFEGGYHGGVFLFSHGGSPINAPFDYVMAPFNDTAATVALVEHHADDLACVVIEPIQGSGGMIQADRAFLEALRSITHRHGVILIFDEVVTSRLSGGGLQEILGVTPDMTTLGKYIGGGAAFGAFGGRADIMARFDPRSPEAVAHAGTFNNNVITHAAGVAAMTQVYTPEIARTFNARGEAFRERLNDLIGHHRLPMVVTGRGSIMQIHCCEGPLKNEHDADKDDELKTHLLFHELLARGQRMTWRNSLLLCLPMTDSDLEVFCESFDDVLGEHGHLFAMD